VIEETLHASRNRRLRINSGFVILILDFGFTMLEQMTLQQRLEFGLSCHVAGDLADAGRIYREILIEHPDNADALHLLGMLMAQTGQRDAGMDLIRRAIAICPNSSVFHSNLGNLLTGANQFEPAIASCREAVRIKPDWAEAHTNLGNALMGICKLDEAIACYRKAISLNPNLPETQSNLANALREAGLFNEAIQFHRNALRIKPDYVVAHSSLIITLHYYPDHNATMIRDELRLWNNLHAQTHKKLIQPHSNTPDPDRRLRIGYVSADFYNHASALFMLPLFRHHDRREFELFCYVQGSDFDSVTQRIMDQAHCWREITGLSDDKVAAQIREDRIDILIDLKLHTAKNRLLVFAQKPAPVQAAWLGYPGSTGLDTIDYRLTDSFLDPPGLHDAFYSEQSIRLPDTFWCYDPLTSEPAVNSLPLTENGFVTFGCLNTFIKVNDALLSLWARILRTIGGSRLLMLAPEGSARDRVLAQLGREGIDSGRVEFVAKQSRRDYLRTYHRIDIGLDTFPYNGHTTSLDSFWMGVPVITLVGPTALGRAGLSQLNNLGLPEFIARTPDEYVRIAAGLACDLPRLIELRRALRPRMEASPLMDAPRFARNIEAAYRQMWHSWCAGAETQNSE